MTRTEWANGILEHEGEHLYYETAGEGEALVFCHGAGGNHAVWFQQVAHFCRSFRVVTWDQRGYGRSSRSSGAIGPVPAARDLGALLDRLEIEHAHVVGQSMGGWCALGFALRHPERVRSLVLADTLGGVFTEEIGSILARESRAEPPPDPAIVGVHPAIEGLADRDAARAFLYQQLSSFTDEVPSVEMVTLLFETRWDLEEIARLDVPVLVVFGEHDQLLPPAALRAMSSLLTKSEVAEIPGCAHSPYFEDPDAWNAVVDRFLARVG